MLSKRYLIYIESEKFYFLLTDLFIVLLITYIRLESFRYAALDYRLKQGSANCGPQDNIELKVYFFKAKKI